MNSSEMLWVILGSVAVVIAAGGSIAASRESWRDVESGRPAYDSVADVTGIWNRSTLDELLGPRDVDDRYTVTPQQVNGIPKTWWKRTFDSDLCDFCCIILALTAPWLFRFHAAFATALLAISATYLMVGYVGALVVVMRNRP